MNAVISDWDISLHLLAVACHVSTACECMCIKKKRKERKIENAEECVGGEKKEEKKYSFA